jgi:segregation and condensation protein B
METTAVMEDAGVSELGASEAGWPRERLSAAIEAILITIDRPLSPARLAEALGLAAPEAEEAGPEGESKPRRRSKAKAAADPADPVGMIAAAIAELNEQYAASGRVFRIESVAGGYRVMTLPEMAPVLAAFHTARASNRLSRAAIETLAIIAYKQPLTRAHLEAIRGVSCGEVLRSLLERRLVAIKGRAEELGRPILYGTTKEFLDAFGLASLKDLPSATELQVNP